MLSKTVEVMVKENWEEIQNKYMLNCKPVSLWEKTQNESLGRSLLGFRTNIKHWPQGLFLQRSHNFIGLVCRAIYALGHCWNQYSNQPTINRVLQLDVVRDKVADNPSKIIVIQAWLWLYPKLCIFQKEYQRPNTMEGEIDFKKIIQPFTKQINN